MSFVDTRLPDDVERGATGGPRFLTNIVELVSGQEKRNQQWQFARAEYEIGYGIQTKAEFSQVVAFFYARKGRAEGFRFKDWSDFEVDTFEQFATGDGSTTAFQLTKTYSDSDSNTFVRTINKPVNGTVSILVNSASQTEGVDYTIDYSTGIVTFTSAPTDTHIIEWQGEFDVPVRFDTDALDLNMLWENAGSVPALALKELRV